MHATFAMKSWMKWHEICETLFFLEKNCVTLSGDISHPFVFNFRGQWLVISGRI